MKGKDITNLAGTEKDSMVVLLDKLEDSVVLKNKYESTIDGSLSSIKQNQDLKDYNVTFKSANDARDVNWSKEIDNLILIKTNVSTVADYELSDVVNDRSTTFDIIGKTLDAVEESSFLGTTQANNIAKQVVTKLTSTLPDEYKVTSVSKNTGETWKDAFDRVVKLPTE